MRNRRSNEIHGYVNFPVDSEEYKSSNEGGLFVRLVVVDEKESVDDSWMVCSGGYQSFSMDETFLRDDQHHINPSKLLKDPDEYNSKEELVRAIEEDQHEVKKPERFHFPDADERSMQPSDRFRSIDYLAILTIGSTGWSGWSEKRGEMWYCTYNDLTEEGKRLYDSLQNLYDGCTIYLQTWLDT